MNLYWIKKLNTYVKELINYVNRIDTWMKDDAEIQKWLIIADRFL